MADKPKFVVHHNTPENPEGIVPLLQQAVFGPPPKPSKSDRVARAMGWVLATVLVASVAIAVVVGLWWLIVKLVMDS